MINSQFWLVTYLSNHIKYLRSNEKYKCDFTGCRQNATTPVYRWQSVVIGGFKRQNTPISKRNGKKSEQPSKVHAKALQRFAWWIFFLARDRPTFLTFPFRLTLNIWQKIKTFQIFQVSLLKIKTVSHVAFPSNRNSGVKSATTRVKGLKS